MGLAFRAEPYNISWYMKVKYNLKRLCWRQTSSHSFLHVESSDGLFWVSYEDRLLIKVFLSLISLWLTFSQIANLGRYPKLHLSTNCPQDFWSTYIHLSSLNTYANAYVMPKLGFEIPRSATCQKPGLTHKQN